MAKQWIGFDIGDCSVKMVHVTGKEIKNTVVAELPDNIVDDGQIISMDAMADFIREHAKQGGLPKADAAVILPTAIMMTRTVTMPVMTERQLVFNLPYEFNDYLKEEKHHYLFDYAVREMKYDEEGKPYEMRIFACAALKEDIEKYRMMFRRAGFKLKLAVPQECAYTNIINGVDREVGRDCCIVDLGHNATRLHIFHGGEYETRRVIDIGNRELDRLIADEKEVDVHVAHSYKENNYEDVLSGESALGLYNRLAVEIMKAVNFFNYNNRSAELSDLYLCGGGAAIRPLVQMIEDVTNLKVHPASELMSQANDEEESYAFLRGYGLVTGE